MWVANKIEVKSKKNEHQFFEVRSFNEFHPLVSPSGMNYSELLTSYKPESDTNVQNDFESKNKYKKRT